MPLRAGRRLLRWHPDHIEEWMERGGSPSAIEEQAEA